MYKSCQETNIFLQHNDLPPKRSHTHSGNSLCCLCMFMYVDTCESISAFECVASGIYLLEFIIQKRGKKTHTKQMHD